MSTHVALPISEYLSTIYEPDCDYVDGEVEERNLGELDHSDLQMQLVKLLSRAGNEGYIRVNPELRIQTGPSRFRVPDVCVRRVPAAREQIVVTPPLLCIEILSPEDRVSRTARKVRDFLDMGVPEVWVIDPAARTVCTYSGSTMTERGTGELAIPGTPIRVSVADIFRVLDEY